MTDTTKPVQESAVGEVNRMTWYYVDNYELAERHAKELDALRAEVAALKPHPDTFYVVWFEDADVKPVAFFGAGAQESAIKFYRSHITSWSCHLLVRMPDAMLAAAEEERRNGA